MKAFYTTDRENPFPGKWRVEGFCTYDPESGWSNFKRYPPRGLIWKFVHKCHVYYPTGNKPLAHKGVLRKYRIRRITGMVATEYAYFPALRKLFFDPCSNAPEGYMNRYRVEKAAENEYWLYDLESENAPGDGMFLRLKVRKL